MGTALLFFVLALASVGPNVYDVYSSRLRVIRGVVDDVAVYIAVLTLLLWSVIGASSFASGAAWK